MKKRMRVMAMILAAALCVSSTPFSVYAEEMETEVVTESTANIVENMFDEDAEQVEDVEVETNREADVEVEVEAEEESVSKDASMAAIVDSGTCGDNVTWTLKDSGVLNINGSGDMYDYSENDIIWNGLKDSIGTVSIGTGVTSIGAYSFCGCTNLRIINLSDTVVDISRNAFHSCSSLKRVHFSSVQTISEEAFCDCTNLKTISMSPSIKQISDGAFRKCTNLKYVYYYGYQNEYESIIINESNSDFLRAEKYYKQIYTKEEEIIATDTINGLTWVLNQKGELWITGNYMGGYWNDCLWAEYADLINSAYINCDVLGIGGSAFYNCKNLKYIVINKDNTLHVGWGAFSGCDALSDVYFKGTEDDWKNNDITYDNGSEKFYAATYHFSSTAPDDTISVVVEEGPEISEMTYLAMSDAAYGKKFDSYKGKGVLGDKAETIKTDDIRMWDGNICNNIPEEYGLTWGDVYKQCLSTWSVLDFVRDDDIGFHAVTFRRDNQIVISYEGSGSLANKLARETDWLADDVGMAFLKEETPQMLPAINYAKQIIKQYGDECEITFTGHSLGGGLAILAANATNCKAVPFDSAPTVEVGYYILWNYLGEAFKGIDKWTYTDVIDESCPVGNYEVGKKNYKAVETQYSGINVFAHHARESILVFDKEKGQFRLTANVNGKAKKYTTNDRYSIKVRHTRLPKALILLYQAAKWIQSDGTLKLGTSINNTMNGIPGSIHTDVVYGGAGVDWLNGYQGDDYLIGGPGDDKLDGNTGNDTYVYFKDQGKDTITDYQGNDVIKLYGFSDSDDIECENINDSATHCCITGNGERIINISKNRSLNPLNSFKVEVMDDAGNVKKEVKIQNWNTWKNVRTYKIACPVNVEIYDADNNLVMTLEDGVEDTIYTEYGNFYCAFNEETNEYDKMVDLVSDYSIKIVGNNDGNMDVSVFETDETGKETEYAANDIPVSNQEVFAINDNTKKLVSDKQEVELSEVKNDTEETGTDDNNEDAGVDKKDSAQNTGTNTGTTVTTKPAASGSASTTVSAPAASKLKKVKAGKKKATLKWKKVSGANGYEIQYGTKKNFKKAKTKTIKKGKTVKTTIKKLKAGKKYYFRIRTYKTVNGKKYYSAWSKAKKVKIK